MVCLADVRLRDYFIFRFFDHVRFDSARTLDGTLTMKNRASMTVRKNNNSKNKKLHISTDQEIKILRRIVDITSSQLDLVWILQEVVKIVTEMTNADSVFIYLFDDKKENLILRASKVPHRRELGKINLKVGEGITGWVAQEKKPVVIKKNAYKDSRFKSIDVLPEDKYEAFLSVPIVYMGKAIGVSTFSTGRPMSTPPIP